MEAKVYGTNAKSMEWSEDLRRKFDIVTKQCIAVCKQMDYEDQIKMLNMYTKFLESSVYNKGFCYNAKVNIKVHIIQADSLTRCCARKSKVNGNGPKFP